MRLRDLYRYHGKVAVLPFLKSSLMNREFSYMLWLRLTNAAVRILPKVSDFCMRGKQNRGGYEILNGPYVGAGLHVGHGIPCITHSSARAGNNVKLSKFVTIASKHGSAAETGDNLNIVSNCVLVDDITIENNVTIGTGSVAILSIPDNRTAAPNPVRVLNQRSPWRYVIKRWPVQEN